MIKVIFLPFLAVTNFIILFACQFLNASKCVSFFIRYILAVIRKFIKIAFS